MHYGQIVENLEKCLDALKVGKIRRREIKNMVQKESSTYQKSVDVE